MGPPLRAARVSIVRHIVASTSKLANARHRNHKEERVHLVTAMVRAATSAAFHGVSVPSTLAETSSDLRRDSTPDCAAPSGFLNLLTRYSARNLSGLVSCR
jgi:hypothetical protein